MKTILATSALALILAVSVAGNASAWTRNSTTTGAYGNSVNHSATGTCSGGTCSRAATTTTPTGRAVTHGGTVSCSGGTCNSNSATTGTYGRTVTHKGTVSVN